MPDRRALPIPFSTPLVRAIRNTEPDVWPAEPIDATKPFKWQTRRLMNPQPDHFHRDIYGKGRPWTQADWERLLPQCGDEEIKPRYRVGDLLYVTEALEPSQSGIVVYAEDGCPAWREGGSVTWPWKVAKLCARYMPKWAARTWLEVMRVRAERLESISEDDARAEGLTLEPCTHPNCGPGSGTRCAVDNYRGMFAVTWNKLHPDAVWGSRPCVFVYDFKRVSSPKGDSK